MKKTLEVKNTLFFTLAIVTLIAVPVFMDPFSLPKLFAASIGSGILLIILGKYYTKFLFTSIKSILIVYFLYISTIVISSIYSNSNLGSILLGSWGRNNGLIVVLVMFIIFLASITLNQSSQIVILLLFYLGIILSSYAWMQYYDKDFMVALFPWLKTNLFIIHLTFGNSNFASVFLAFTFTATLCVFLESIHRKLNSLYMFFSVVSIFSHVLLIPKIDTQGKIAYGIGLGIVLFIYLIFSTFKFAKMYSFIFFSTATATGIFGLLGLRGIGPFAGMLSDNIRALNDRYFAWLAAIEMIKDFPIFGVGMNSFIDSYRLYRLPGAYEVVTQQYYMDFDNAHNTYLHIGATLGIFSLILYIILIVVITFKALKAFKNNRSNSIFNSGLLAIWVIYLITSIVSIDYIILAIWGWVCVGTLIGNTLDHNSLNLTVDGNLKTKSKALKFNFSTNALILLALLPSLYIVPQLVNDNRIFDLISKVPKSSSKMQMEKNIEELTRAAENTKQFQLRLVIIDYLGYAGADDSVYKLSKLSVEENPNSFWAWEFLARSLESKGMLEQAKQARIRTLELDPLNQTIKSKVLEDQRTK
jgi:O-antigen ligase